MLKTFAVVLGAVAIGALTLMATTEPTDARGGGGRGGGGGGHHGGGSFRGGGGGGFHGGSFARSAPAFRSASVAFRAAPVIRSAPVVRHHVVHRRVYAAPVYVASSYGSGCAWLRHRALETGSPYWWERYRRCIGHY